MAKKFIKTIALDLTVFAMLMTALMFFPNGIFSGFGITASAVAFSGGDGSSGNPYRISTAADLAAIAQQVNSGNTHYKDEYFELSRNIDLGGMEWTPIGKNDSTYWFQGNFDGGSYTISNLTITQETGEGFLGLFGCNSGTIRNLYIENVKIITAKYGTYPAGAVCGINSNGGTIEKCGVDSGTIVDDISYYNIGGVCGVNHGTVSQCYNKANLTAKNGKVAGISGANYQGTIENCYNAGTITQTGTNANNYLAGGICSYNGSSTIENCLNFGKVTSANGTSYGSGNGGTVNHFYYDIDVCGSLDGTGGGKTTAELCSGSLPYSTFDSSIWEVGSSSEVKKGRLKTVKYTYPSLKGVGSAVTAVGKQTYDFSLTADGTTYEEFTPITTAEEFMAIGNNDDSRAKNYVLMNNINFKGAEIDPIGKQFESLKGKFSGNGYTISNFTINKSSDDCVGLFGYNNGTIMNLAVEGGNVTGGSYVGGICGENEGTIYACSFDGTVSGNNSVGVICGQNEYSGEISNCFNSGNVNGSVSVGGVCGLQNGRSSISYCISVGTVTGVGYVGGVLGENQGSSATINYCYFDNSVCKLEDELSVGNMNLVESSKLYVNRSDTGALCVNSTILDNFNTGETVWETGSIPTEVTDVDGRFGKKTYTYIHLKDIGKAKSIDISVYNFSANVNNPDWKTYAPISTAAEFRKITDLSQNYVLMNDIDFKNAAITPIGKGYAFYGKFSGDGHTISNFNINSSGDNVGLFEKIDTNGMVMNLGVVDGKVNGSNNVGTICGQSKGAIVNCYVFADVEATGGYAGGICGQNTATIRNCYFVGTVTANNNVSPIAAGSGFIQNCYYNKDLFAGEYSVIGLTTQGMTSGDALNYFMSGFDSFLTKKTNDKGANGSGTAYYPSFSNSNVTPSVTYTTALEFKKLSPNKPVIGDDIVFEGSMKISFANGGSANYINTDQFAIRIGEKNVVEGGKFTKDVDKMTFSATYKTAAAGKITFTLVYDNQNCAYVNGELTKDLEVEVEKKTLAADDFTFSAPTDLVFDNTAKAATVTTDVADVGEITVNYYKDGVIAAPVNAGTYTVKINVAESDVYNAATDLTAAGWEFTIAKGTQNIDVPAVYTLTYGETGKIAAATDGNGALSYAVTDGFSIINAAVDGTIKALRAGEATVEVTAAETENCKQASKTVSIIVNKAAVTITAKSYTVKVGNALPTFEYTAAGLINGEKLPIIPQIFCTADGKTEGEFSIIVSGDAESMNYVYTYNDGTLTVSSKDVQTITASDVTMTYGEVGKITAATDGDGVISYEVKTGGDIISVATDGTVTALKAGTAVVEITAAETNLCAKAVNTVNVTVNKAAVTITVKSYSIKAGEVLPAFEYTVTGLVNGDMLPFEVTVSCAADGKTEGEFPIIVSGEAESMNYTFTYNNGTLTVSSKEAQTITASDVTMTYGETRKITAATDGDGALSYAVKIGGDIISVAADGTITALKAGTATVEITAAGTDHYAEAVKTVNVTVNKAVVTITAKKYTVKTGSALPTFEYMVTGLVNGDTLTFVPNITCAAKDTSTVGAYDIIVAVSITEDERYTYTTQNGTLTIERNSTPVGPVGPVGPNIPTIPTTPANSTDQQRPTNEPKIKGENDKSGWNAIVQEVKSANDGDIITVDMNGTTELPKKILETIKGKDVDIVLDMGNGFTWTINGNDVKKTQSVDMSVSKGAKIPVRVLNKVTGENSYIAISLKHNGSFGFKAVLTVELSKKNKGLFANLYYYNSKTKKTEFISSDKIGSDGKADFGFTHASDYVIVLDKANHGKPIVTATATKNSIKLKWNAVSGATKYRVYKIVNGKARLVIETTKHGLNINKAKSDTEYQYIVRAYIDGSWTSMKKSDIVTVKTKQ